MAGTVIEPDYRQSLPLLDHDETARVLCYETYTYVQVI
jgi:hypothetical protein